MANSATTSAPGCAANGAPSSPTQTPAGQPGHLRARKPRTDQSINFVSCHDGFTLNDVVSYNSKHNEANGEDNRDGANDNRSWNHGVEGPSDDPAIENLRERQIKNFFAYTLLSMGTPMLQMGDEIRRTQNGNNNAYCQDNEISWFDLSLVEKYAGLRRFVREMIHFRLHYFSNLTFEDKPLSQVLREADISSARYPHWPARLVPDSRSLAIHVAAGGGAYLTHVIFNTYWEGLDFSLPPLAQGMTWRLLADTNLASPADIQAPQDAIPINGITYRAAPRSVVVLVSWK